MYVYVCMGPYMEGPNKAYVYEPQKVHAPEGVCGPQEAYVCMWAPECVCGPREAQRGPETPEKPESLREAQRRTKKPREAQKDAQRRTKVFDRTEN